MFTHLKKINMSYSKHFLFSSKLSLLLFNHSIKAFIHALYPDVYKESTSELLKILSHELKFSNKD